ncbi:MAG: nucleotide pyrophosphohydrolase [Candidatus Dojkabacteria bacterium]
MDKDLIKRIVQFRDERDWKQFHSPENLAKSINIEAAELLECFQWSSKYEKKEACEELADVLIYCVLMGEALEVDLSEIIEKKLKKNGEKYPVSKAKGNSKKYTKL